MAKTARPGPAPKVKISSAWPGSVTLRRGWARATARPWNQDYEDAHLRIIRGGPGFTAGCAVALTAAGAPSVISPPLPTPARRPWLDAGFEPYVELALLKLDLRPAPPLPDHLIQEGKRSDLDAAVKIDAEAFQPFWRLDKLGITEAMDATPKSSLLVIRGEPGELAAFAVLGMGHALSYLQRVAVSPRWQRRGMGRSMVRAAARRARQAGAGAMLLNTQTDNEPALALYEEENFTRLTDALGLMRRVGI